MALTKEQKTSIIEKYQLDKNDTGSVEVQVALLTERINELNGDYQNILNILKENLGAELR